MKFNSFVLSVLLVLISFVQTKNASAQITSSTPDRKGLVVSIIPRAQADGSIKLSYCQGPLQDLRGKFNVEAACQKEIIMGTFTSAEALHSALSRAVARDLTEGMMVSGAMSVATFLVGGVSIVIGKATGATIDFVFNLVSALAGNATHLNAAQAPQVESRLAHLWAENKPSILLVSASAVVFAAGSAYAYYDSHHKMDAVRVLDSALSGSGDSRLILQSNSKVDQLEQFFMQPAFSTTGF